MTPARRRTRGFGLVMMLLVVGLLAVFAVVATRLIHTSLTLYREAGQIDAEARSTDAALRQLRGDVWGAGRVTARAPGELTIDDGTGGATVTWRADADGDGTLVRTGADPATDVQRWPGAGRPLTFEWDGVALTVRGADRGADRAGGIRIVSQRMLADAGGGK